MARVRPIYSSLRWAATVFMAAGLAMTAGCQTGPRMHRLTDQDFPSRPSMYPIETFAGKVQRPHVEIAIIESNAYDIDDPLTREAQLDQLRETARELGADAVDSLRILAKTVHGYTSDERAPAPTFKQGEYPLYFMRGRALVYQSSLDLEVPGTSPGQVLPSDIPLQLPDEDFDEGLDPAIQR